jgi:hypothetical protein
MSRLKKSFDENDPDSSFNLKKMKRNRMMGPEDEDMMENDSDHMLGQDQID